MKGDAYMKKVEKDKYKELAMVFIVVTVVVVILLKHVSPFSSTKVQSTTVSTTQTNIASKESSMQKTLSSIKGTDIVDSIGTFACGYSLVYTDGYINIIGDGVEGKMTSNTLDMVVFSANERSKKTANTIIHRTTGKTIEMKNDISYIHAVKKVGVYSIDVK